MIWGLLIYVFDLFNIRGSFLSLIFSFWIFRNCIIIRNQNSHFLFYKTFWSEASLYMFLIFWSFRESFLSLIFFLNFEIGFWIRITTFGGVSFIKLFYLRPPYICFWNFGTVGDLLWVWFFVSENFEIVFWIRIPTFGGVCFIKLFDLRPPYICF